MRRESGDTLVEVLIATAILGAAVVAGLGIMNFGFGIILNSIERTQVQASVNSQLSFIQYARDAYVRAGRQGTEPGGPKVWNDILAHATATYSPNVCHASGRPDTDVGRNPFYIDIANGATPPEKVAEFVPMTDFPAATTVPTAGNGLWVEAVRPTDTTNYIDFYVKACWPPAAGSTSQESRSVMRLYTGDSVAVATVPTPTTPTCNNLESYSNNLIANGNFSISAGSGPGVAAAAGFSSDLPNRGPGVYPDDDGVNGTSPVYTGGFSIQTGGPHYYGPPAYPNAMLARAFSGDPARGVPAINTYFYSNPNQRVSDPPGTTNWSGFEGVLWRQTVLNLQENSTYDFTAYIDNLLRPGWAVTGITKNPIIQLRANGVPVMPPMEIMVEPDEYQRVSLVFATAPGQTSVTLDIYDYARDINGDDFAMTGLALRRCI